MEYTHESIFKSSIRAFFKVFFVILGIFAAFIPIMIAMAAMSSSADVEDSYKVSILPDLKGKQKTLPVNTPAILRIDIEGTIGKKGLTTEGMYTQLIESRRGLLENERVKGILLFINTPGGTVNDSDGIYTLIKAYKEKYKVPVYSFVNGLCASGGMYIASSSDKILSNPVSIVGSIGVLVGPFFNAMDAIEKLGLKTLTVTQGIGKDTLSPFRKWDENEDQSMKNISSSLYNQFVNIVTNARPNLSKEKLINEYGANVFVAKTAEENGYIDDSNATYESALEELLKAANIDTEKPYQVVTMKPKQDFFKYFANSKALLLDGKIKHTVQLGPYDLSEIKDPFSFLYHPAARD